jgi:hypothetical protein
VGLKEIEGVKLGVVADILFRDKRLADRAAVDETEDG